MNDVAQKESILETLLREVQEPVPEETSEGSSRTVPEDEVIDLGQDFNFDGFQVVRREFFAHLNEPSATFNDCKFSVNCACLKKFPTTTSVQVLINKDTKIMALMPCPDGAKDSFVWCKTVKGKLNPRPITCKLFFAKLVELMDWNPIYKYKLLGKLIQANGQVLLAFDLSATEVYQKTPRKGAKPTTSRTPVFPAEWQNQFGLPYNEHRRSFQVNIFDGYAIYSIKDTTSTDNSDANSYVSAQKHVRNDLEGSV